MWTKAVTVPGVDCKQLWQWLSHRMLMSLMTCWDFALVVSFVLQWLDSGEVQGVMVHVVCPSVWTTVQHVWHVPHVYPDSSLSGSGVRMWQQQPVQTCVTAPRDQHGRRRKRLRTEREMRCGQLKQTKRERHIQPFILIHIIEVFIGGWDEFKFLTFSISETDRQLIQIIQKIRCWNN